MRALAAQVSQEATFEQASACGMSVAKYHALLEAEGEMAAGDALQTATDEAKNSLEEYVYGLRSKVQGECAEFVAEGERAALVAELNAMEDWLYEDGEDEKKSVRRCACVTTNVPVDRFCRSALQRVARGWAVCSRVVASVCSCVLVARGAVGD
jgi:Hsp70 protein